MFLILLFIIPLTFGQLIEISPIDSEHGFTLFKTDEKLIIDSYVKILHIIDLKEYDEIIRAIESNIRSLNLGTSTDEYRLLDRELALVKQNLDTIVPHVYDNNRQKRGLFNIVGSAMKYIAGTMDHDDATDIYNHLDNLEQNSRQITNQLNKQVFINNNLIKNVNNVVNQINKQQLELSTFLGNITNQANKIVDAVDKTKYTLQIYADINVISRQLEKISDVILMSKLNILPHDILTKEEKIRYNVSTIILPYIKNSVLYKNEKLIFAISIPVFTNEKYFKALVIPFPNNQHEELDTNIEEVIIQNNDVYNSDRDIMLKKNLKFHNNECIRNAFKKDNVCKLRLNDVPSVEEIDDGLVITKNLEVTEVAQDCIEQKIVLRGNNLIKFNNCKLKINDLVLKNYVKKFKSRVMVPITHVNFTKLINNLTLENLKIKNIENREKIEYIQFKHNVVNSISMSISTVLIIIVIVFLFLKFKLCKPKNQENITRIEVIDKLKVDPFAGSANNLRDGGVI